MTELSNDSVNRLRKIVDEPDFGDTRYRLIKKIDIGGMGTIWLAEDTQLARNVALKVVSSDLTKDSLSQRLNHEAHLLARLEHPGIVPVYDIGHLPDNSIFFAMKYVEGLTLERYAQLTRNRYTLLTVFAKICEAVAFAHSRGVIHRDLKPTNVMIGQFGEVLVMDWGIALFQKQSHEQPLTNSTAHDVNAFDATRHTSDGAVIGTPQYMSPEQVRGDNADLTPQTDIYGLGGILYFLFTLTSPVAGENFDEIKQRILQGARKPLNSDLVSDKRLSAIVDKTMALLPHDRYANAIALADDIARFTQQEPVSAYLESAWEKSERWIAKNKFLVTLVIVYMVVRFLVFIALRV
jgi:eukaryotic-like serine/threonine-protein kinase